MIKKSKRKFKKFIDFLKRLPKVLAQKAFLTFLVSLFIALIFGTFIFYQYSILAKISLGVIEKEKPLKFEQKTYQEILKEWQERNKRFSEADFKKYPDPFYLMIPSREE